MININTKSNLNNAKLEYCFAEEKETVFTQQKQSLPMSNKDFVEITIFQNARFHRDECVLCVCAFLLLFFFVVVVVFALLLRNPRWPQKNGKKTIFEKQTPDESVDSLGLKILPLYRAPFPR